MDGRRLIQMLGITTIFCSFGWVVYLSPIQAQDALGPTNTYAPVSASWGSGWGTNWGGDRWPGAAGSSKPWSLGVDGTNTQAGVIVNRVWPNSAASSAGISQSDVIICVGGDQVGQVGGRVFELSEELARHADPRGSVDLLIQDGRSLRLRPLRVQLGVEQSGLTGTLLLPSGRLPADAVVTIQLENISRPQYVVRNGEYSFRPPPYSTGPIPFTLNFDPRYIFSGDTYQVRAYVTSGGRTIYDMPRPQYVLTKGNPSSLQLRLAPAAYMNVGSASNGNNGGVITAGYANYDVISQRVTTAYEQYLGRRPSAMELAAWHQIPDIEYRLTRLPLEIMGSQEYFDLVGDNNVVWVRKVFGEILGRTPSALELDQWMRRFSELRYSRMELLNQMKSVA